MPIERKPVTQGAPPDYPTRASFTHDRRHFLGLLGTGAAALLAPDAARAGGVPPLRMDEAPPAEPEEPLPGDVPPPEDPPDDPPAKPKEPLPGDPPPPGRAQAHEAPATASAPPPADEPTPCEEPPAEPPRRKTAGVPPRHVPPEEPEEPQDPEEPPAKPEVPLPGKPAPPPDRPPPPPPGTAGLHLPRRGATRAET